MEHNGASQSIEPSVDDFRDVHITSEYTLFNRITLIKDNAGAYWFPEQWAKDLEFHTWYIDKLSVCCPVATGVPPDNFVCAEIYPSLNRINIIELNHDKGWFRVFRNFFPNFLAVRKALRTAKIAHSGGAGWPFPNSYYILPLRRFENFKWIIIIESSFWRMTDFEKFTLRRFIGSKLNHLLLRLCINDADVRIFTTGFYKDLLLDNGKAGYVRHASWINPEFCLSDADARARWQDTLSQRRRAKFIFPARLIPEKGVIILLRALTILDEKGIDLQLDIMGTGELEEACKAHIANLKLRLLSSQFLPSVPYGDAFFEVIGGYDAVLVPSLSEEQPRILFDAFSQGVPVIASNTSGIREIVEDGVTGFLHEAGDPIPLVQAICSAAEDRTLLQDAGLAALKFTRSHTHVAMHLDRARLLSQVLGQNHSYYRDL